MLKKLYDKSKIWFSVFWIVLYCVLMSVADAISQTVGMEKALSAPVALLLSGGLLAFLWRHGLLREYGLCKSRASAKSMLFYLPLLLLPVINFMSGFGMRYGAAESVLYVLCMLCVGFLEEIIFRGLLFLAMYKDTPRAAIAVSSITFGIGHIINLINGSGADLLSNLLQVAYASAAGFMFVMIFVRSESLLACIVAHGVFNALSAFCPDPDTVAVEILSALALILVSGAYGLWLVLMPWVGKGTQERAHASPYNRDNKNAEDAQR